MNISDSQISAAVKRYPRAVTGPMSGCKHPEEVLRYVLIAGGLAGRLAGNFILNGHGACWNAMCGVMDANAWLRWYAGENKAT